MKDRTPEDPKGKTRLPFVLIFISSIVVPAILYTGIIFLSRSTFGPSRILGWDSLAYALSAQETLSHGIPWMVSFWGHPNVYVLLLAAFASVAGNPAGLVNLLPIALVMALSLASGIMVQRLTGLSGALLAVVLTAVSMATFRLYVDLHRALLAFVAVTFLLALDAPGHLRVLKIGWGGVGLLGLALVAAFSEFEIYLAFLAGSVLWLVLSEGRRIRKAVSIGWLSLPGVVFAATPSGLALLDILTPSSTGGALKELTLDLSMLYASTVVLVPFILLGVASLLLVRRHRKDPVATGLLTWVVTLFLIFLLFGLLLERISPFRALILMHLPVLATLGAYHLPPAIVRLLREGKDQLPRGHFLRISPSYNAGRVVFAFAATGLVLVSGTTVYNNATKFLYPVVPDELHSRLIQAAGSVEEEWPEPLLLLANRSWIHVLPPIRNEFSLASRFALIYFGDVNFLPWIIRPELIDPEVESSRFRTRMLNDEYELLTEWVSTDSYQVLAHPVVVISPELFPKTLPEEFDEYLVAPGIHVIPPRGLTLETFLTWELIAVEDSYGLGSATTASRNWSRSDRVVEIYSESGFEITYPYYFPRSGAYAFTIHLFDFPRNDYGTTTPLSPLTLSVGEEVADTLTYGQNLVTWWNVTLEHDEGFDLITLQAASESLPFRMSLDVIEISAQDS